MQIKISSQFSMDFKKINDRSFHQKVKEIMSVLKEQATIEKVSYFKNIQGNENAFKMAVGFYFLILYKTGVSEYTFMRCLSRDEVLKFQLK